MKKDLSKYLVGAKKYLALAFLSVALFIVLTLSLILFDVGGIGPRESRIGLSTINLFFFRLFVVNDWLNVVSDIFAILAVLVIVFFAGYGFYQLIKRKSLKKVDADLYLLAVVYFFMVVVYLFFEFVVINYRPILVDGILEPSFPSTHSLLVFTVFGTAIFEIKEKITKESVKKYLIVTAITIMVLAFIVRVASGYHWFTDVLASLFIALIFSFGFAALKVIIKNYLLDIADIGEEISEDNQTVENITEQDLEELEYELESEDIGTEETEGVIEDTE